MADTKSRTAARVGSGVRRDQSEIGRSRDLTSAAVGTLGDEVTLHVYQQRPTLRFLSRQGDIHHESHCLPHVMSALRRDNGPGQPPFPFPSPETLTSADICLTPGPGRAPSLGPGPHKTRLGWLECHHKVRDQWPGHPLLPVNHLNGEPPPQTILGNSQKRHDLADAHILR